MKTITTTIISGALFAAAATFALPSHALFECKDCGTVIDVKTFTKKGEGSGAGAVIGGIAGGVLGHQVGSGRGNTAATVVGAGAGAYAGNEVEKSRKSTTSYQVVVKLEDGKTRTFNFTRPTSYKAGDKVKIVDGKLTRQ
jgi:outer membrane lipoprotein SlyB